jgi:hypothetical protein
VAVAGCIPAEVYYTPLLRPPRALVPRRAEDVQLLVVTPPSAPHLDIGLLQITEGYDVPDSDALVTRLRAEAGARGCDAVLVTSIENQAPKNARPSIHGSCIVYSLSPVARSAGCPGPRRTAAAPDARRAVVRGREISGTAAGNVHFITKQRLAP